MVFEMGGAGVYVTIKFEYSCQLRELWTANYYTAPLTMWILFQMRPDIKKDVFHLNWAPESLPADEVSIEELRVHRVDILLNIL